MRRWSVAAVVIALATSVVAVMVFRSVGGSGAVDAAKPVADAGGGVSAPSSMSSARERADAEDEAHWGPGGYRAFERTMREIEAMDAEAKKDAATQLCEAMLRAYTPEDERARRRLHQVWSRLGDAIDAPVFERVAGVLVDGPRDRYAEDALRLLAQRAQGQNRTVEAEDFLRRRLKLAEELAAKDPYFAGRVDESRYWLAMFLAGRQRHREALEVAGEGPSAAKIARDPQGSGSWYILMSSFAERAGDKGRAADLLERLLREVPKYGAEDGGVISVRSRLIELRTEGEGVERALGYAALWEDVRGEDKAAILNVGNNAVVLLSHARRPEARVVVEQLDRRFDELWDSLGDLGRAGWSKQRASIRMRLVEALADEGRMEEARSLLKDLAERFPESQERPPFVRLAERLK